MSKHTKFTRKLGSFCKDSCPICTKAREQGKGLLQTIVKFEEKICPACRSYKKVYGVPAHKKVGE